MPSGSTARLSVKQCRLCGQRFTNDAAFCPFDGEPLVPIVDRPQMDPLIGTIVDDRYRVIESIGEGGMGLVYRVQHRDLPKTFAMKVLRANLAREPELSARFIKEAQTAATISHPNVVQITDFGYLPARLPYFVMELLEGQPLSEILRTAGQLPAARAIHILEQVGAGVQAAHDAGIIHRDLKPENIFVLTTGVEQVKLVDFGVAKVAGEARRTRTGTVFGSPHYMSPEQAMGKGVDLRADIYSLGIIMYQLFTGTVPFEADTYMGVLTKHIFAAPEPFSTKLDNAAALGALEAITMKCLEKRPGNRYQNVTSLLDDVHEVLRLGGGVQFSQRPSRLTSTPLSPAAPLDLGLADELELPSKDEIAAARRLESTGDIRMKVAIAAVAVGFVALTIAVAALVLTRHKTTSGTQTPSTSSIPSTSSAPTAPLVPSSPSSQVAPDAAIPTKPSQAHSETAPPPPAPPTPAPRNTRRKPHTRPAPPRPKPTGPSNNGELVNPWAN